MNLNDLGFARFGRAILTEFRTRAVVRTLQRFDDRLLADIGVYRGEIDSLVRGRTRRRG
jgi:uncharacterized protein YjiS (DUF1127 family)